MGNYDGYFVQNVHLNNVKRDSFQFSFQQQHDLYMI